MDQHDRSPGDADARQIGAERLQARRRRTKVIRKRVVALAVTGFLALWGVIFAQLVSGHDPALGAGTGATTTTTANTTTTSGSTSGAATSSSSRSSGSSGASASASPVTTSQS